MCKLPHLVIVAFLSLAACSWQDVKELGGGIGLDLPGLDVVRLCTFPDDTSIEVCSDLSDEELEASLSEHWLDAASCEETPRHLGPCRFSCELGAWGANAFNGMWCPPEEEETP